MPKEAFVYASATAPGCVSASQSAPATGSQPLALTLEPGARITGEVTFDGRPVPKARVRAMQLNVDRGMRSEEQAGAAETGKDGRYNMTVRPGLTRVFVEAAPDGRLVGPTLKDLTAKVSVPLSGIDFHLQVGTPIKVSVKTAEDKQPVAGAEIYFASMDNRSLTLSTDGAGIATAFMPSGRAYLALNGFAGFRADNVKTAFAEVAEGQPKEVEFFVHLARTLAPKPVSGVVTDAEGRSVAGAKVEIIDPKFNQVTQPSRESTDSKGRFLFKEPVTPGVHMVATAPNGEMSDISEVLGPTISLQLKSKGSVLRGRVISEGKPKKGVSVTLGGQLIDGFAGNWSTQTDSEGRYVFERLPYGLKSYFLWAKLEGYGEESIQPIYLERSEQKDLDDINMLPADGTLSGVVVDDTGKPVAHAVVSAQQNSAGSSQIADDKGHFSLTHIRRGSFVLTAQKDDWFAAVEAKTGGDEVIVKLVQSKSDRTGTTVSSDVTGMDAKDLDVASWIQGEPTKIVGQKEKYILLDFFATNCAPCLISMPAIQKLQDDYQTQLIVIGVCDAWQAEKKLPKIIKDKKVRYRIAIDKADKRGYPVSHQLYGYRGNPNLVLINQKGQVVLTTCDIEDVQALLKKLLRN